MAINVNNLIINGEVSEPVKAETPKPPQIVRQRVKAPKIKVSNPNNEHTLIIDGKEKKIRKQSSYLLDMLTIDD